MQKSDIKITLIFLSCNHKNTTIIDITNYLHIYFTKFLDYCIIDKVEFKLIDKFIIFMILLLAFFLVIEYDILSIMYLI